MRKIQNTRLCCNIFITTDILSDLEFASRRQQHYPANQGLSPPALCTPHQHPKPLWLRAADLERRWVSQNSSSIFQRLSAALPNQHISDTSSCLSVIQPSTTQCSIKNQSLCGYSNSFCLSALYNQQHFLPSIPTPEHKQH